MYGKVALQLGCNGDRGEGGEQEEKLAGMWYAESVSYLTGCNAPSNDLPHVTTQRELYTKISISRTHPYIYKTPPEILH